MRSLRRLLRGHAAAGGPTRLHIGSGQQSIPGWINIDNRDYPGVDRVLDVRKGLPFEDASAIYAEHFLEHLGLEEGMRFLEDCRGVLAPGGVLRLSTPNLDWVLLTHYRGPLTEPDDARDDCIRLNRAFHGWGHQFLYNRAMLASALKAVGFGRVVFCAYGESDVPELKGLERHQTWEDAPELPHVLIAEASGALPPEKIPANLMAEFREAIEAK